MGGDYDEEQSGHYTQSPRPSLGRGHSFDLGFIPDADRSDRDWLVASVALDVGIHSSLGMISMALLEQRGLLSLTGKETFVVADAFKVGTTIGGRILSVIGWNFSEHFLGSTEHHVLQTRIAAWTLLYAAGDKWILQSLNEQPDGGACALANVYGLMMLSEMASNHLDGQSNFAYVRSPINRQLWAVHWLVNSANEWTIGLVQVPHPAIDWRSGSCLFTSQNVHVLSRKHQVRHH